MKHTDNIHVDVIMELIKSNQGGKLLSYESFVYRKYRSLKSRLYWFCLKSSDKVSKFPAKLVTNDDLDNLIYYKSSDHCHTPDPREIIKLKKSARA